MVTNTNPFSIIGIIMAANKYIFIVLLHVYMSFLFFFFNFYFNVNVKLRFIKLDLCTSLSFYNYVKE